MARILYGVHGSGHGHAMRALTVARHYPQHEFLFVSCDAGMRALRREYPVFECPDLDTPIRSHRVATLQLLRHNLPIWRDRDTIIEIVQGLIESFRPDAAFTDYEFFLPRACRRMGIPCLSLDHQHIVTACFHPVPVWQLSSYFATHFSISALFSSASDFITSSFFQPKPNQSQSVRVVPPLLRKVVLAGKPSEGDHVVAYQGHPTYDRFFTFLKSIDRPVRVYGFHREGKEGNLHFRPQSEEAFLEDVASCSYVMCGGGHTLISEALFLGKPVLSFPIVNAFEQYLNAFYLERMGWGKCAPVPDFCNPRVFMKRFEEDLGSYRENIRRGQFFGNDVLFPLIDHFIEHGRLPDTTPSAE